MQVFIDDFRITAADLLTIAQGGTPPSVAALAQLKKRCKLVWVAVSPVTNDYSWAGEECDLEADLLLEGETMTMTAGSFSRRRVEKRKKPRKERLTISPPPASQGRQASGRMRPGG